MKRAWSPNHLQTLGGGETIGMFLISLKILINSPPSADTESTSSTSLPLTVIVWPTRHTYSPLSSNSILSAISIWCLHVSTLGSGNGCLIGLPASQPRSQPCPSDPSSTC